MLAAERNAQPFNAIFPGSGKEELSPARADVEQPHSFGKPKLPKNMMDLLVLGLFERVIMMAKIGAAIRHRFVEPETIEVVTDVVMVLDLPALGRAGVALGAIKPSAQVGPAFALPIFGGDLDEQIERAVKVNQAIHVRFAHAQRAFKQDRAHRGGLSDVKREFWFRSVRLGCSIPVVDAEPTFADDCFKKLMENSSFKHRGFPFPTKGHRCS